MSTPRVHPLLSSTYQLEQLEFRQVRAEKLRDGSSSIKKVEGNHVAFGDRDVLAAPLGDGALDVGGGVWRF